MELTRIRTSRADLAVRIDGPEGAPHLVLSNSLGTSLEMWDPQVRVLAAHFRVVRYDQRGHGGSSSPAGPFTMADLGRDLLGLLDALECERANVAGVSLGGMIGMWVAANAPDRLDKLVLACTSPFMGPPEPWLERAQKVRADGTSALAETLLGRWFSSGYLAAHPEVGSVFTSMVDEASDDGYASCCEAIASMDQRPLLADIVAPTLVLVGAEDPVVSPATALEMHQAIPGSSLVVLDHASHLANVERPEAFSAALVAHLTGTPVERGLRTRRRVLGEAYVDEAGRRATGSGVEAVGEFQRLITEGAWGNVWSRPAIDLRGRRLLTVALLAALGRLEEFELHARAALEDESGTGLDAEEIGEVLIHTSVYAGAPAANAAFGVLARLTTDLAE